MNNYVAVSLVASKAGLNSPATDCLGVYLFGQKFEPITDHRPSVWLRTMKNPNSKLVRWIIKLDEFDFEVIYKQGRLNNNADALSRIDLPTTSAM